MRRALLVGLEDLTGRPLAALRAAGWSVVRVERVEEADDLPADVVVFGEDHEEGLKTRRAQGRNEPAVAIVEAQAEGRALSAGFAATLAPDWSGAMLASVLDLTRVRALRPGYDPREDELEAIDAIVEGVDRLPLAIELAAGQLRHMGLQQLRERFSQALRESLGATLAWSFERLTERARRALGAASLFAGALSLEALAQVAGQDCTEALAELRQAQLLQFDRQGRPRLLSSVRAAVPDPGPLLRERHADWVLTARPLPFDEAKAALSFLRTSDLRRFAELLDLLLTDRATCLDRAMREQVAADLERLAEVDLPSELRASLQIEHANLIRYRGDPVRAGPGRERAGHRLVAPPAGSGLDAARAGPQRAGVHRPRPRGAGGHRQGAGGAGAVGQRPLPPRSCTEARSPLVRGQGAARAHRGQGA